MGTILHSLVGMAGLLALAWALGWALGEARDRVPWRILSTGIALQLVIALVLLKLPAAQTGFMVLADGVDALMSATRAGTSFVFGYIGGSETPFDSMPYGSTFILAFQALPLVLVISALSALLYYWRVLPAMVRGFAWALRKTMGIGGATGVSAIANIFVGMVEAPLLVRPYIGGLSRSALFMVMTCGMATIAGTVLVLYATILAPVLPGAAGHLLTASLISAPAAIVVAALMVPPLTATPEPPVDLPHSDAHNSMEAVVKGTTDGLQLLLNIIALLVVMVALVALANQILGLLPDIADAPLSLQRLFGWVLAPVAWLMGIPWAEANSAGSLLGTKTVLNELIAYADLVALPAGALSPRSTMIMTYAICGFANFGSLGILIGGMGTMAPERRTEIIELGFKSIIAGTLATCLTGAVVGLIT